jgi:hypothetical protein
MFAMEAFEEQELPFRYTAVADNLKVIRQRIALEGMSRDDAAVLEAVCPDIFSDKNIKAFTAFPSNTMRSLALERIDFKRLGVLTAAAAAIIFVITKVISWLSDAFGTLGGKGGAITNTDKVNQDVKEAAEKVVPVAKEPAASTVTTSAATGSFPGRYLTSEDSVQNGYLHRLSALMEKTKLDERQAKDAAALYADSIRSVFRLTDRDTREHMVLGEMLLSKHGAIPQVLEAYEWEGKDGKIQMTSTHFLAMHNWLSRASSLIDVLRSTVEQVGRIREPEKGSDGQYVVDGDLKRAVQSVIHMLGTASRAIDNKRQDPAPIITFETDMPSATMTDRGLRSGKFRAAIDPEFRTVLDAINERSGNYVGMWVDGDYQKGKVISPARHRKVVTGLMSEKGLDQLGRLHRSIFDEKGKPRFESDLSVLRKRMSDLNASIKLLKGKAGEGSYLTQPILVDIPNSDQKQEIEIMDALMSTLDLTKDVMNVVQMSFAALGKLAEGARYAVEIVDRGTKRVS